MAVAQPADTDDVRVAYQTAIQIFVYEGTTDWRITSTFATFNTLLLAVAAYPLITQAQGRAFQLAAVVLALAGVVASVIWWSMLARSRQYHDYWLRSARELEQYLDPRIQTLQRGERWRQGQLIEVAGDRMVMPWYARLRMAVALHFVFGFFCVAYSWFFCPWPTAWSSSAPVHNDREPSEFVSRSSESGDGPKHVR